MFGGYEYSPNVSLVSLDGGPPVPDCLQNLNPHPEGLSLSCAATLGSSKLPNILGEVATCSEGFVICFLKVPLACLGSMAAAV